MKKIFFLFLIVFASYINVSANTITQSFENVFITCEDENGEKIVTAVNVIKLGTQYLYKIYLGDVSFKNYEVYDSDLLKTSVETSLSEIVYYQNELNTDNDTKWYYVAQYEIYNKIYSGNVYFSDSSGNKIDYLIDEIEEFEAAINYRYYDYTTIEIYNNEVLDIQGTLSGKSNELTYSKVDDGYSIQVNSGTGGTLYLYNLYNEGEESVYYVNTDNNILFAGGGEFYHNDTIRIELKNVFTVVDDNPSTGVNPFIPLIIGIPIIIIGALVVIMVKEIKEKNSKNTNKM